ncbi:aldo/keto reductase [Terasakiella sp. SH-1]|uniref:aldo/keto reductase n=1 Tax=Terasakiella sp. SH-1 TaxID=2560057 RepID=UPI0010749006|nr:aldo/keto reductase [Terasakiella sp. SH-1]
MSTVNFKDLNRLGYGAMVLEGYYGGIDDNQAVEVLRHCIEKGLMIDSADAYGNGHNEELIAKAIKGQRDQAFIASKFGIVFDAQQSGSDVETGWGFSLSINGTKSYVTQALDASLNRLGTEYIDLYYAHYPDPNVAIEETVEAMAKAKDAGKIRYLGLSNVTADQIRRAHAVHPISAVQYEYSLWRREAETDLLPTLRELGIALVGWSPLGSGFLTGKVDTVNEGDFRTNNPRFVGENLKANQDRFAPLKEIAKDLGITPAQLALAWLCHQGDDIYAIPGSRKISRIDENMAAADIKLDEELLAKIDRLMPVGATQGATLV